MNEISQKQLEANKQNAKLGGVKTEEGKATSRFNAITHGILGEIISDYEQNFCDGVSEYLNEYFNPIGILEKMLVDRIGVCYLKLYRVAKAENEYIKSKLNRRKVEIKSLYPEETGYIVKNEGYIPRIHDDEVEKLSNVYLRYEVAIENRLYKALHELERLQARRNGENVPLPVDIDVNVIGRDTNGFV